MLAISTSMPFDTALIVAVNVLWQITMVLILALSMAWFARTSPSVRTWVLSLALILVLFSPITSILFQSTGTGWLSIAMAPVASTQDPDAPYLPNKAALTESAAAQRSPPMSLQGQIDGPRGMASRRLDGTQSIESSQALDQNRSMTIGYNPNLNTNSPSLDTDRNVSQVLSNAANQLHWLQTLRTVGPWVMFVWCIGVAWKLLRLAAGYVRLVRILRTARPNQNRSVEATFRNVVKSLGISNSETDLASLALGKLPKLMLSDRLDGPIAAGLLRPRIVLPEHMIGSMTTQQLRDVLIHEMAHVIRRDQFFALLQNFVAALFWIHPLVRILNRYLAQSREEICDNYVLSVTDAPTYSRTLLSLSELVQDRAALPCSVGLFTSRWKLEHRIMGLLDTRRNRMTKLSAHGWMLVAASSIILMTLVALGTFRTVVAQAENPTNTSGSSLDDSATDTESRVFVEGIVLKPDGKPAIGATVRSSANVPLALKHFVGKGFQPKITETKTDQRGWFKIEVNKQPFGDVSRLDEKYQDAWKRSQISACMAGYGPNWIDYVEIANQESVTLNLVEDIPITGRIIDTEGRPVANVNISIEEYSYFASEKEDLSDWLEGIKIGEPPWMAVKRAPREGDLRLIQVPIETKSRPDGTFEIRGLGRERIVRLAFVSDSVAQEVVTVATRMMESTFRYLDVGFRPDIPQKKQAVFGAEFTLTAQPARLITGQILDADTKKPLSGVDVESRRVGFKYFSSMRPLSVKTDADGRFRLVGMPKGEGNILRIRPNDDQPYLMRDVVVPDPEGMDPVPLHIELKPGIWITGKVIDRITRLPIEGVRLHYLPYLSNTYAQARPEFGENGNMMGDQFRYKTNKDGSYRIVGLPGRAVVGAESVLAPYRVGVGYEEIATANDNKNGHELFYSNPVTPSPRWPSVITEINPKEDIDSITLDFELDPGPAIQAKLVDDSKQPVEQGVQLYGFSGRSGMATTQGRSDYWIKALDRNDPRQVYVFHRERNIGRVATIGAEEIEAGHIDLVLLPCAKVSGRLMSDGTPCAGIVIQPRILPDKDFSPILPTVCTDLEGRFECNLLPGCHYRLFAEGASLDRYAIVADELEIQPGKPIDLGILELQADWKFTSKDPAIEAIRDSKSHGDSQKMMMKKK
jgi:beta-lactamase regulating signal transducer with metallopeptidase domain